MLPLRRCSKGKENDDEASAEIEDCLEKFEITSTSTTLGADQPAVRNGSLSGSGIGSNLHRIVLEDYIELASTSRWASA